MQDLGGNKSFDGEILAEGRLGEDQELMLYNMSLRQTSQHAAGGREGTHMLVSRVEDNPTYQEMIERGLLDCKIYGQGVDDSAAATLLVTQKGLRYCVLFADEIEPRRAFDVAGVQRECLTGGGQAPSSGGVNYSDLIWGAAEGGSAAKNAAFALTSEQVASFERLSAGARNEGTLASSGSAVRWKR